MNTKKCDRYINVINSLKILYTKNSLIMVSTQIKLN